MNVQRGFILLILACLLAACSPAVETETPTETQVVDSESVENPAVQAARRSLAEALRVDDESIKIISVESVMWRDSCLGIDSLDLMCIQVITPGYRIILEVDGEQFEAHTDEGGGQVLFTEPIRSE